MLRAARLAGLLALVVFGGGRLAAGEKPALALARLSLVERRVELGRGGESWQEAVEGQQVSLGEAVRLGEEAVARLELPWMTITISSGAALRFPDQLLLSAVLEQGRALIEAERHETLKLVTDEAEVRGRGRAIVRRRGRMTLVSCLAGSFRVATTAGSVPLAAGQGTVVRSGRSPGAPEALPAAPGGLWPGQDPVYVAVGRPLALRWRGAAAGYQLELLPVGADVVLMQRDVGAPPLQIEVPWDGAFRWRVSARDDRGLEGLPSQEGLIAVEGR